MEPWENIVGFFPGYRVGKTYPGVYTFSCCTTAGSMHGKRAGIQSAKAEATPRGVALPLSPPHHAAASPPSCTSAGPDLSSGFRWNDG